MTVEKNGQDDARALYLRIWERLFFEFLGWDKSELMEWANGWHLFNDPDSMFYHESPIYYAAPRLVPEALRSSLSRTQRDRLFFRIEAAVDQPALYGSGTEEYDWSIAKKRVRELLDEFRCPFQLAAPE